MTRHLLIIFLTTGSLQAMEGSDNGVKLVPESPDAAAPQEDSGESAQSVSFHTDESTLELPEKGRMSRQVSIVDAPVLSRDSFLRLPREDQVKYFEELSKRGFDVRKVGHRRSNSADPAELQKMRNQWVHGTKKDSGSNSPTQHQLIRGRSYSDFNHGAQLSHSGGSSPTAKKGLGGLLTRFMPKPPKGKSSPITIGRKSSDSGPSNPSRSPEGDPTSALSKALVLAQSRKARRLPLTWVLPQ